MRKFFELDAEANENEFKGVAYTGIFLITLAAAFICSMAFIVLKVL